nr:DegT/DnrJ/EryC1/StrS family aminotransferase [Lachnospiraceae bacterium]
MKERIYLSSPTMHGEEMKYVQEAFDTNWVAPLGPNVNAFEEEFAAYLGEGVHTAALSAGSAAIHLAMIISGVKRDDIVFGSDLTFAAT